ncbi:LADA_0B07096g1_1 [Lachancea dasiensis]|uniref:LADA_0B07096g1_1 n=1 Tax=Lachancea dasiensis TaxID=1072105 RepID=A0A1G4ITU5_9SACH|nr:LADA_0B07096g1_1 [Lachancea dasiensis]
MLKGSSPLKGESSFSVDQTPPSLKIPNFARQDAECSPSPFLDESPSLNDDLMSVNSSINKTDRLRYLSGRISAESASVRQSFESTSVWGRQSKLYAPGADIHSGSEEYSPLGNNSVYELVMNTRRRNWLKRPTIDDIPPIILSKNELPATWREDTEKYTGNIKSEHKQFEYHNNLEAVKGLNRLRFEELGKEVSRQSSQEELGENEDFKPRQDGMPTGIPKFYFDENFKLDDSRAFRKIIDDLDFQIEDLYSESKEDRNATYQNLKERLTDYLDDIEYLLVIEISKSSNSFFYALEDVDKIDSKAADTIEKLAAVSQGLLEVDRDWFQAQIKLLQKKIKRKNIEKLEQGLLQAKLVTELVAECKNLFKDGNHAKCLELVNHVNNLLKGDDNHDEDIQEMTKKWPYKLSNLWSTPAFANIVEELTGMCVEIAGAYSLDFSEILLQEIRLSYTPETELSAYAFSQQRLNDSDQDAALAASVKDITKKLLQCGGVASAFQHYNERFLVELKNIIKDFLPKESQIDMESADRTADSKNIGNGSKLSRLIRAQTPSDFQEMLIKIFVRETEALRRLSRHQKVLLDVALSHFTGNVNGKVADPEMIMQLDINPAIHEGVRTVQLRMGKIIAVRRDLTAKLRYDHFLQLCSVCFWFDRKCEDITGELLTKYLRDVLTMQIKTFCATLNSQNAVNIRTAVEKESWTPSIVEAHVQRDVNDVVSSVHITPASWVAIMDLGSETPGTGDSVDIPVNEETLGSPSRGHRKSVVVNDKTFVASGALLEVIGVIKSMLVLSVNLPSSFLATFEKNCYDLMLYFNSRAMASVSTGADNTPSLKSGKNLSILGESLDCLTEFATLIQMFYQRLSSIHRDFEAITPETYMQLMKVFQTSSDKLYQAHAPPPPV